MSLTKSLPVLSTFSKDQLLILLIFNKKKKVHESLLCQLLECQSSKTLIILGSKGKAETQTFLASFLTLFLLLNPV